MSEAKIQRPAEALSALKVSVVLAIITEIQWMKAMFSNDFRMVLEIIKNNVFHSERIVLGVVGGPGGAYSDQRGLLVKPVAGGKIFWIDSKKIQGLDPGTLTPGTHIFAERRGEKYRSIPIEERF